MRGWSSAATRAWMKIGPCPVWSNARIAAAPSISDDLLDVRKSAGLRGGGEIDAGGGMARLHAGGAVVPVVEHDDREIFRLLDPDGGEAAHSHQHVAVAGDHRHAAVRPRQRKAQAHHRGRAHRAPEIEIERMVAAGRDVIGRRAEPGDHHQVAALDQQAGDEVTTIHHHQWPPVLLRSTMRCESRIATCRLPPNAMLQPAATTSSMSSSRSTR